MREAEDDLAAGDAGAGPGALPRPRPRADCTRGGDDGSPRPRGGHYHLRKCLLVTGAAILVVLSLSNVAPHLFKSPKTVPAPEDVSARVVRPVSNQSSAIDFFQKHAPGNADDSFRLENLDFGGNTCCGHHKCFFRLTRRPDVAYLVSQAKGKNTQTRKLKDLLRAWHLGQELEKKHAQLQLGLAPPKVIRIDFTHELNRNWSHCDDRKQVSEAHYRDGDLIVQKVRPVPTPSLLFGCASQKKKRFFQAWDAELRARVRDGATFRRNLAEGVAALADLLTSGPAEAACLAAGLKFFVDARGRLYHLNLDRCSRSQASEKGLGASLKCLDELRRHVDPTFRGTNPPRPTDAPTQLPIQEFTRNHTGNASIGIASAHRPGSDDNSFRLENLETGGKICCGFWKCFYRHRRRTDVGYVVLQSEKREVRFKRALATWRLEQRLEQNFSIPALMLGPPEDIVINEEFAAELSRNTRNCDNGKPFGHGYATGHVVVQRVRPAPVPSLLFGCRDNKMERFFETWEAELLAHVRDGAAFRRNLTAAVATAADLRAIGPTPGCLAYDFQALVDSRGHMHHVDLDRCFEAEKLFRHKNSQALHMRDGLLECLAQLTSRVERAFSFESNTSLTRNQH